MHPVDLQAVVTNARDFEATKLEANYAQAVNLVMNRSSDLDSKLKQFSKTINQKLERYLANNNQAIYQTPQQHNNQGNSNHFYNQLHPTLLTNQQWQQETHKQPLISNILSATISNDESLAAIFSFKLEKTTPVSLFSGATLDTKPITTIYTDTKVNGHTIKLILDSRSVGSIITKQFMDQLGCQVDHIASARIIIADGMTKIPIGEINNFPIEVNGITLIRSYELTATTTNYHQYYLKMTTTKENRKKNSLGTPTKSGKLTTTRKN
ncbi:hypothetical protein G9A89_011574 [Geosiphon pyriformis]|nr:hypothetical protein G9A89_011574 [Geosiphon pyriformis]